MLGTASVAASFRWERFCVVNDGTAGVADGWVPPGRCHHNGQLRLSSALSFWSFSESHCPRTPPPVPPAKTAVRRPVSPVSTQPCMRPRVVSQAAFTVFQAGLQQGSGSVPFDINVLFLHQL